MPNLSITKTYADNTVLSEADLDNIIDDVETFFNTTKIDSTNIQTSGIATANIADEAITADKLDAAIAGDGLAGAAGSALSVNVDDSTIEISSDTLQVKDAGITRAKLEAVGQQQSSSCDAYSTTSTIYTTVTNLSVSITTSGRPVLVQLIFDQNGSFPGELYASRAANTLTWLWRLKRDSTVIEEAKYTMANDTSVAVPEWSWAPSSVRTIDFPSAGTYTYTMDVRADTSGTTIKVQRVRLLVLEL